jgi:hypothetical protein
MKEHCHTKLLATRYSLFAIRYSLPFFFRLADLPTSRLADNLARQEFRPPTSFRPASLAPRPTPRFKSVATKTKPVKQANKKLRVLGCAFREKALTLNSQPATRNPSNSRPPRVGVQIRHHSLLAIHLTGTSLIYCCWRKCYLFWQNEQRGDGLWTSCGLWQWRST